jgi:Fe-Mn family superoxide dismutase
MEGNNRKYFINLDMKNTAVRNNGGGFYNHNLFWNVMTPNGGGLPTGDLLTAIESAFELLKSLKQNLKRTTIWFRLGLALCSQRWKTRCLELQIKIIH